MYKNKKGVSPVIATVLLILVAVILFSIILWWVRQFIKEDVQKDLGGGPEPIQTFCKDVIFSADVVFVPQSVIVQNDGQVPIYGIQVQKKGFASVTNLGEVHSEFNAVIAGDTQTFDGSDLEYAIGDNLLLIPILLGETKDGQKAYPCDESFGTEVIVI